MRILHFYRAAAFRIRDCIPPSSISSLCATSDGALYFIGGSPTEPPAIWRLDRPGDSSCVAEVIVPSVEPHALNMKELAPFFSPPRLLSFPNARSGFSFGYFYPPNNLSPSNRQNFKPPLLVKVKYMHLWQPFYLLSSVLNGIFIFLCLFRCVIC